MLFNYCAISASNQPNKIITFTLFSNFQIDQLYCKAPQLYDRDPGAFPLDPGNRWATIDGDADRLLYFYIPDVPDSATGAGDEPKIILLDGDRISCLFATLIKRLLPPERKLTIGVIQTAYANAASSIYLEQELNVPVVCVPTGVKHLHRAAQKFDFGIYFEVSEYLKCFVFSQPLSSYQNFPLISLFHSFQCRPLK